MRLIDNHGEPLTRQLPDLLCDHGEFLERGYDNRLPRLERLFELPGGGVDVLDNAERLLELPHCALELAVEDTPVGDDDDRVEDAPVGRIVERRQLVCEPSDG